MEYGHYILWSVFYPQKYTLKNDRWSIDFDTTINVAHHSFVGQAKRTTGDVRDLYSVELNLYVTSHLFVEIYKLPTFFDFVKITFNSK